MVNSHSKCFPTGRFTRNGHVICTVGAAKGPQQPVFRYLRIFEVTLVIWAPSPRHAQHMLGAQHCPASQGLGLLNNIRPSKESWSCLYQGLIFVFTAFHSLCSLHTGEMDRCYLQTLGRNRPFADSFLVFSDICYLVLLPAMQAVSSGDTTNSSQCSLFWVSYLPSYARKSSFTHLTSCQMGTESIELYLVSFEAPVPHLHITFAAAGTGAKPQWMALKRGRNKKNPVSLFLWFFTAIRTVNVSK